MDVPHHKIWQRAPFVNLSDTMMFIRGSDATNDAQTPFAVARSPDLPATEAEALIARRFCIDFPAFRQAWAALRPRA